MSVLRNAYYALKPLIPRRLQVELRRKMVMSKRARCRDVWPIDPQSATPPRDWRGWPDNKQFALVLTHDVDTGVGYRKCPDLVGLEERLGFCSAYYFVAERYPVSMDFLRSLQAKGFEVGVHGLKHDGKLYRSADVFHERAVRINHYLKEWHAVGFRSPAMHHNLEWLHELNVAYDASTFDTDPFEPQSDGVKTIFPFWVSGAKQGEGYIELPYTLVQDFTVFILMQEQSPKIWQQKLDWVAEKGGMAHLITHPDYTRFATGEARLTEYPVRYYETFLNYVEQRYAGQYWNALPQDVAQFWKSGCVYPQERVAA